MPPAQQQSLLQQAISHHRAGRLAEAAAIYARIRAVAPRNFDAVHLLGVVALQQNRASDAVDLLKKALTLDAKQHVCRMRLGLALMAVGRAKEAETEFREALRLQPDFVEGWDNLAYCLKAQDRLREAVECHQRSTTLNPRSAASWHNYGLTLSLYGRIAEALQCHERALAVDPSYARALFGRAQALQQCDRIPEAIAAYDAYLQREPGHFDAHSYRLFAFNYLDDVTPERVFAEHVAFGRAVGEFPVPAFPNDPTPERRLRVAVLSPDLRSHSCAYFLEPLVAHLDRGEFELFFYHDHFREDATSARLKSLATVWRNFVGQSGPAVEKTIRADQPDILIDLAGHTGMTNRLPIFARHLAPVQITYLGYPNTTGLPAMGYRFTDGVADPEGAADALATERLVRFAPTAWAYQPPLRAPEPGAAPSLASVGAPFTFGCFNNLGKINDAALRVWERILAAVPDARLLLKGRGLGSAETRAAYAQRFAAAGIAPERIDLVERTEQTDDHLAVYQRVDVSLDTFPYNGTTTTCESLWMGVPVVSLAGDRHASRVGASLLSAVGHPEWVASNADDYVRIASELAAAREQLAGIRSGLRGEIQRSPLGDHAGQSRRFAAALRSCWTEWCATRQPAAVAAPCA